LLHRLWVEDSEYQPLRQSQAVAAR